MSLVALVEEYICACELTDRRSSAASSLEISDELNPVNRQGQLPRVIDASDDNELSIPVHEELGVGLNGSSYNTVISDEQPSKRTTSDITSDRHYEGLMTAADENVVSSMTTDELIPIRLAEVTPTTGNENMISAADSQTTVDSADMASAKSSFVVYDMDSAQEDIQQSTPSNSKPEPT